MIQIAFLRAVNVGGTGKLPMADLRAAVEKAGFRNVRTLLASGNLVFDAGAKSPGSSEAVLEALCAKAFGLKNGIYVRTPSELAEVIAANLFVKEARSDPGHLHVMFMREAAPAAGFKTLQAAIKGRELVKGSGRHAYIVYPDGAGTSKLTSAMIEKHLGTPGTARNWNTVNKLSALAAG